MTALWALARRTAPSRRKPVSLAFVLRLSDMPRLLVLPVFLLALSSHAAAQDADDDGVADASDRCPSEGETYDGADDGDGCPEAGAVAVLRFGADEIVLLTPLRFDIEHATLRPESRAVLEVLAATLLAHPERGVLRVEGHMSPATYRERRDMSSRLWLDRAHTVVAFLVSRGVPTARLSATSLVTDAPICDPSTVRGPRRRRACERQNDRIVLRWEAPPARP